MATIAIPQQPQVAEPAINGDRIHSQTLDHFTSYPLILDIWGIYKSNSLGKKSIELYNKAYGAFFEPIEPYLRGPYNFAKPTLVRVDSFGNSSLDTLDSHFPAVTETNIDSLRDYAHQAAQLPFKLSAEGRDYFFGIYNEEYKKSGGQGPVFRVKALLSTELRIVSDILHQIGDRLGPKRDELNARLEELKKLGYSKVDEAQKNAKQVKKTAENKAEDVKEQTNSN